MARGGDFLNSLPCDDTILCKNEMLSYQGQNKSNGLACDLVNLLQSMKMVPASGGTVLGLCNMLWDTLSSPNFVKYVETLDKTVCKTRFPQMYPVPHLKQ